MKLYKNDFSIALTSTSGCIEECQCGSFFNCFFDVEPANVMFEVCFSTEELGAYFNLREKNRVSHHTMTLGVGDLRKMSNTSCNTDRYILVLGREKPGALVQLGNYLYTS